MKLKVCVTIKNFLNMMRRLITSDQKSDVIAAINLIFVSSNVLTPCSRNTFA